MVLKEHTIINIIFNINNIINICLCPKIYLKYNIFKLK